MSSNTRSSSQPLARRVVLVTGSGQGIGASCARHAAASGAAIVVNDIDAAAAEGVAAAINHSGGQASACVADIGTWAGAAQAVAHGVDHFGALHGLVNNAAVFTMGQLDGLQEEKIAQVLAVNVLGPIYCAHHAVKRMLSNGQGGSIVNVTSNAQEGIANMSVYGASKGAVSSLTFAWAAELRAQSIRVNAIAPRAIRR
jgi:NAD(P)-dependent dehydrogenase (short-subunit alcohol dehydrogenase family)